MRPTLIENYYPDVYSTLVAEVPWANREAPRDECFMGHGSVEYTYGKGFYRTYTAVPFHPIVLDIMDRLNKDANYNVCFLNYYASEKEHLGWHADDSPEMNPNHPIAVVSFGAARYIWTKEKSHKGPIPLEDRFLLYSGSLFVMPAGYQAEHYHKIPKHDQPCGGRISLTFRNLI